MYSKSGAVSIIELTEIRHDYLQKELMCPLRTNGWLILSGSGRLSRSFSIGLSATSILSMRIVRSRSTATILLRRNINFANRREVSAWLDRHGTWAIFFGRLVPGVRSLISIPAGIARMKFGSFLLLTTFGSALWSALLAAAGFLLGSHFEAVEKFIGPVSNAILVGVVLLYAWRVSRGKARRAAH